MARASEKSGSLRFSRGEIARIAVALLLSLCVHFAGWGSYFEGNKHNWWKKKTEPTQLQATAHRKTQTNPAAQPPEEPDMFVDVSHADADAPEQPKFYSNKNSHAANQEVGNLNAPKIIGSQTVAPKAETVPNVQPKKESVPQQESKPDNTPQLPKLQPAFAPALQPVMPPPQLAQIEPQLEMPQPVGETDLARHQTNSPATAKQQPSPEQPSPRPRTLKQALGQRDQTPGPSMKQEGGVARRADLSAFDAKATPFGEYDRGLIDAIVTRWDNYLDNHAWSHPGKVMVRFKLKSDGTVIEVQSLENTMGELQGYLCQESIEEAQPFAKWPSDMERMIGANYREYVFTFNYY